MNAVRAIERWWYLFRVGRDHKRWPLGTTVEILPGHHSPGAVGLVGKVSKHGYPCRSGVDCIVDFPAPVLDLQFGAPRYSHYVDFRHLRRLLEARSA